MTQLLQVRSLTFHHLGESQKSMSTLFKLSCMEEMTVLFSITCNVLREVKAKQINRIEKTNVKLL